MVRHHYYQLERGLTHPLPQPCHFDIGDSKLTKEDIEKGFKHKDRDGDGKISIGEHDEHVLEWIRNMAEQAIQKGDKNNDGVLDKAEFMAIQAEL
jgi:Ca2+-binding EF-hand superfamily protein